MLILLFVFVVMGLCYALNTVVIYGFILLWIMLHMVIQLLKYFS